jgi:hypothetical protein
MSLVVDELWAGVVEALPGDDVENAGYLRALAEQLIQYADDLDPSDSIEGLEAIRALGRRHGIAVAYLDRGVFEGNLGRELADAEWDRIKPDLEGYDEWLDNSGARESISFYVSMLLEKHGIGEEPSIQPYSPTWGIGQVADGLT